MLKPIKANKVAVFGFRSVVDEAEYGSGEIAIKCSAECIASGIEGDVRTDRGRVSLLKSYRLPRIKPSRGVQGHVLLNTSV